MNDEEVEIEEGRLPPGHFFASVPISRSVVSPESEIAKLGGFAWTEYGIRVGHLSSEFSGYDDPLQKMRNMDHWDYWKTSRPAQKTE